MMRQPTRRDFLKTAAALPICATALGGILSSTKLKTSLNAYSFAKLLNDRLRDRGPGISLIQVLEFAAKTGFDGFDATGYYFPTYPQVPPDSTISELKERAADLGIGISGTGVRDNLTTADKTVRAQSVEHIRQWLEVAAKLGAPVLRVFADTQIRAKTWHDVAPGCTRDQVEAWIADDLHQCAVKAAQVGVCVGVQNHGDFLQTGDQLIKLASDVNSPACRPIVDTGYFKTTDPYVDMAIVAPHAVNWQIKQSPFGEESDIPMDLLRLMRIVRKSGYEGYLPIETLSPRGKPYDPFTVVPAFLKKLEAAIAETA